MQLELVPAKLDDREILMNLLEKYNYEFSQYDGRDVNKLGLFGHRYLDYYWTHENADTDWAHFIRADGNLAGFVITTDMPQVPDRETDFAIADFFVLYKYRRTGVGAFAAASTFDRYKGRWQLKRHPKNIGSVHFWDRVVDRYTGGAYELVRAYPGTEYPDGTPGDIFFFESK